MRSEFESYFRKTLFYSNMISSAAENGITISPFEVMRGQYRNTYVQLAYSVYSHKKYKVDELMPQVAEMKSRLNDVYTDGQIAMYMARQSKIDELQKKLDEYIFVAESIDEMYVREVKKNNDLQKRVDAVKQLIKDYKDPSITSDKSFQHGLLLVADELEQALKGGSDHE